MRYYKTFNDDKLKVLFSEIAYLFKDYENNFYYLFCLPLNGYENNKYILNNFFEKKVDKIECIL